MDAHTIIRALGGPTKLAPQIGASRSAVSNWPRDGIPARYWPKIARVAALTPATASITLEVLEAHHINPAVRSQDSAAAQHARAEAVSGAAR